LPRFSLVLFIVFVLLALATATYADETLDPSSLIGQAVGNANGATDAPTAVARSQPAAPAGHLVALDPGHSPSDTGAAAFQPDGTVLVERDLALRVALKTAALLRSAGYRVLLTRTADVDVNAFHADLNGDGVVNFHDELQARIDLVNAAGAEALVSIHFNGSADSSLRGTEVYYNPERTFGLANTRLASLLLDRLVRTLVRAGYLETVNRGLKLDTDFPGDDHFYLLGASNTHRIARGSQMPGAVAEALFVSNPFDAAWLRQENTLTALALGYSEAITTYFGGR
jgi:N-acetylmuramoyl-L-alanine amidase